MLENSPTFKENNVEMKMEKGNIAVSSDKNNNKKSAILTLAAEVHRKEKDNNLQSLNVEVDFIFDVVAKNDTFDEEEFSKVARNYALSFCLIKLEDIVKQITQIDYGGPIIIQDFPFPSDTKLERLSPEEAEKEES